MDRNSIPFFLEWTKRTEHATKSAHRILSKYEGSTQSRVIELREITRKLDALPVDIKSYFFESVRCLEVDLRRAAIVMAWAGFFEVFIERLYLIHENDIRNKRPKWNFDNLSELKEKNSESSIIDVAKDVKFINNAIRRVMDGQLSSRNLCAHPSLYNPTLNYAIGYVSEIIAQTEKYI